jgi:hypothetical protein
LTARHKPPFTPHKDFQPKTAALKVVTYFEHGCFVAAISESQTQPYIYVSEIHEVDELKILEPTEKRPPSPRTYRRSTDAYGNHSSVK